MNNHRLIAAALCAAAALAPSTSRALSYITPSDRDLYVQSEGVLVATVVGEADTDWSAALPQRRYLLEVERVLIGVPRQGTAELRLPGSDGRGELGVFLPGIPELSPGDRVLVFHDSDQHGALRPLQLGLGVFFERIADDGRRMYERRMGDAVDLGKATAAYQLPRDAERFERWIGAGAAVAPDYLQSQLKTAPAHAKFALTRTAAGTPIRWFTFDDGGSVEWRAVAGTQAGGTYAVDQRISEGLAAWSGDANSRISLSYNPSRVASDSGALVADGVNVVVWDDPANLIAGSFVCGGSGVIALAGQYFSLGTRRFDGSDYHPATEGFLITQDNSACFLNRNGGVNAAEVFAHELGHTLGFAHPCGDAGQTACVPGTAADDATMRRVLHEDGRGGGLVDDDRAAALRVYPSPQFVHPLEDDVDGSTAGSQPGPGANPQGSRFASSSGDGRFLVFQSDSTLPGYAGDSNGLSDIYVIDSLTGCVRRASVGDGDEGCAGVVKAGASKAAQITADSIEPAVSASGEWVTFVTETAAVPAVSNETPAQRKRRVSAKTTGWSIFLRNMLTGRTFEVGSAASTGTGTSPQLAADGQSVTFVSDTQPAASENANGGAFDSQPDVFVAQPMLGNPLNGFSIACVSCKSDPGQPVGPPASNASGSMVAYAQGGSMRLQNLLTGQVQSAGQADTSARPSLDYSGNQLVFSSTAPLDGDGSDDNGQPDVYLFQGCCGSVSRISKPDTELANPSLQKPATQPALSGDGSKVAYVSAAQNLMGFTPEDNSNDNIYVYDVRRHVNRRLSRGSDGQQANGDSARPFLDYTGASLVFDSAASNLDGSDSNGVQDVFKRANPLAEFEVFNSSFE